MKKLLSLSAVFLLFFTFTAITQDLKDSLITKQNAHLITSYDIDNIESMVTFYFASRIRGDEKWKEVVPKESVWTSRMRYSIQKHDTWEFIKFQNLGYLKDKYGNSGVKVYFCITYNGREDCGKDDVELKWDGERWTIWVVPN